MSNNENVKSGWTIAGEILGTTLGVIGAIGAVAGAGYLAKEAAEEGARQAKRMREERHRFSASVDFRLAELNSKHASVGLIKQQMIKEEVSRLLDVQSNDKRKHFDRLNELFDMLLAEADVLSVVNATRERDKLLKELAEPVVNLAGAMTYEGMTRRELYAEIKKLNRDYKSASWQTREQYDQIKESVYAKLEQLPEYMTRSELYAELDLLKEIQPTGFYSWKEQEYCDRVRKVITKALSR